MPSRYIAAEQRRQVELRANRCCEYCKSPKDYASHSASHSFHVEHIYAYLCWRNRFFIHPRQQVWGEHFEWSADRLEIIGVTPYGRATVNALKLNRLEVINLRRIMLPVGLHPPED